MDNPFKSFFHLKPKRQVCPVCFARLVEGHEVPVVKHIGRMTDQQLVCSKDCAQQLVLRHKREEGL
jgi:hypothetical protein